SVCAVPNKRVDIACLGWWRQRRGIFFQGDRVMTTQLPKTIQEYIDECPTWSDGTSVSSAPMTTMQWRIWWLASAGKFFEGLVVFMTGVALPLIALEFDLGATQMGMVGAAPLFGILIGASALGGLADRFGRRTMFIVEMALFLVFL